MNDSTDEPGAPFEAGYRLLMRYLDFSELDDLDRAVLAFEAAMTPLLIESPELALFLSFYANALVMRFQRDERPDDLAGAIRSYFHCCDNALETNPRLALTAAQEWGDWASNRQSWDEAKTAYGFGMAASSKLFRANFTRLNREAWLEQATHLPARAAYASARVGDYESAVEAVETGRALFFSEALDLVRVSLDGLVQAGRPDLKDRYEAAAARWRMQFA